MFSSSSLGILYLYSTANIKRGHTSMAGLFGVHVQVIHRNSEFSKACHGKNTTSFCQIALRLLMRSWFPCPPLLARTNWMSMEKLIALSRQSMALWIWDDVPRFCTIWCLELRHSLIQDSFVRSTNWRSDARKFCEIWIRRWLARHLSACAAVKCFRVALFLFALLFAHVIDI